MLLTDDDLKPDDDEKIEDDLLEDDDEKIEEDDLEIDLDDADEKAQREERDRNKAFAAMRVENKQLKDSVDNLSQQMNKVNKPAPVQQAPVNPGIPTTDKEWDDLADKDWKKAVDLRSIQNAKNLLGQQQRATKANSILEDSKKKVLDVHPEIDDDNSEKARIFKNIISENPDYLSLPKGPLYAMRDMEEYMETTLGYKRSEIRNAEKKGAKREASRQNRIVLNKGSGRTNTGSKNKVVLAKDELEFCKFQGIDPKEYARNKQKLSKSNTEEVST